MGLVFDELLFDKFYGMAAQELKRYDDAEKSFNTAQEKATAGNYQDVIIGVQHNLGSLMLAQGELVAYAS